MSPWDDFARLNIITCRASSKIKAGDPVIVSTPPTNIGEFVKLYGVSGHFTVPIPSEGQIKPLGGPSPLVRGMDRMTGKWVIEEPWGMNFYDVPEAKFRNIHLDFDRPVTEKLTKNGDYIIRDWEFLELAQVKKPFNSEGSIK